jgi:hypothetical protein
MKTRSTMLAIVLVSAIVIANAQTDTTDRNRTDRDRRDRMENEATERLGRESDKIKDETKDRMKREADEQRSERMKEDKEKKEKKNKGESKNSRVDFKREVTGGFQNPESIIAYKRHLYVTNLGTALDPMAKDADGYISKLKRKNGEMVEQRFIAGLHSPKGMFIKRGKLHVADVDRVVAFNVKNKKKVWEADLTQQGVTYANDLTNVAGGLLVSSTDNNAIYKVCRSGKVKELKVKGDLSGVNGMVRGARKVYVANYGRGESPSGGFGKIKLAGKKYKEFHNGGVYDGIARIPGRLVLSDWSGDNAQGRLVTYRPLGKKFKEVNLDRAFDGPADLYTDKKKKLVWIPVMRENRLVALSFADVKRR